MKSLYFIGIAGTGMAAVAGCCQARGYRVGGSDRAVYPPTSELLAELAIDYHQQFASDNIASFAPDSVIVGNRITRDNPEVQYTLANNLPLLSFPQLLTEQFLRDKTSVVIAGTHGKTTTTSLTAHVLQELGSDPSFIVGGLPLNFARNFRLGNGDFFCLEGDEYGSAFFDSQPKFLHYHPQYLLLNAIELDHADIYQDLQAVKEQFAQLIAQVNGPRRIVANIDCPNVAELTKGLDCITVSPFGNNKDAEVIVIDYPPRTKNLELQSLVFGRLSLPTMLRGDYNAANIAMVVALLGALSLQSDELRDAVASFRGVKKRLQLLFDIEGVVAYEDFAHHPTAVRLVLNNLRQIYPQRRIIAVFDFKSASSKRQVFFADYATSLAIADRILLREYQIDKRIPVAERLDPLALAAEIGEKAKACCDDQLLERTLVSELSRGDVIVFMSCASYGSLPTDVERQWLDRYNRTKT